jgi:hypothetical protein
VGDVHHIDAQCHPCPVKVREPFPDGNDPQRPLEPAGPDGVNPAKPADSVEFRVSRRLTLIKFGVAALLVVAGLLGRDRVALALGVGAALGLAAYAARDLLAPVRLAADRSALVLVRGYAARRRLPWSDIVEVRVDERTRFGREVQNLEIDTEDELFLFSAHELGVAPAQALDVLTHLRPSTVE